MTKKEAMRHFREHILPHIPEHDRVAKAEAFSNYVDMLCRDGEITEKQAFEWDNPF